MPGMSPRIKAKKGRFGAGGLPHTVEILSPAANSTVTGTGSPLTGAQTFVGKSLDDIGGDISSTIVWTSNVDGGLGTGASVYAAALTAGAHRITATVTVSGLVVTDSIDITVA